MSTPEEFEALARQVASQAQVIRTKTGRYLWWAGRAGEELWLQVDRRDQFVGMHPHFTGKSSVRVGLEARVRREQHPTLVGAFRGWASPQDDQPSSGTYPFIFDLPDAARYEGLPLPCIVQAQLAAFAHEMTVYDSLEAYQVAQNTQGIKFAAPSFFPAGMLPPSDDFPELADSVAIFTGSVVEAELRMNGLTGEAFCSALVDTLGGTYDVVIDQSFGLEVPRVGAVLSGVFWLSGRLTSIPPRTRSWLGRMLGRP